MKLSETIKTFSGIKLSVEAEPFNPLLPSLCLGLSNWRVVIRGRKLRGHDGRATGVFHITRGYDHSYMPRVPAIMYELGVECAIWESRRDLCVLLGIPATVANRNWEELAMRRFKRTARDLRFVLQTPKYGELLASDDIVAFCANPKMHTFGREPGIFSEIELSNLTL